MLKSVPFLMAMLVVCARASAEDNWNQWRGALGTGEASQNSRPPIVWGEDENVRWRTKIPGRGHSTPIVWQGSVFLTTAERVGKPLSPRMSGRPGAHDNAPIDSRYRFKVVAIDRANGNIRWSTTVGEAVPQEGGHRSASLASASPVTDGTHVYAFFGSHGLFCLDFEGNVVWQRQLGQMHTKHGHGEGSSPALFRDVLVVNWDHEGDSFVVAIDKHSGKDRWRKRRDEVTSWSSPLVVDYDGRVQVIVCGTSKTRGYDLRNGDTLWECGGLSANIVATPVFSEGVLYVGSSYDSRALMAIRLQGAQGDISDTDHVAWSRSRGTPYVPSLLVADRGLYYLSHYQNVLTRVDAGSGRDAPGPMRLGELSDIYASPIAAGGYVFVTDLDGATMVITDGDTPRAVAVNRIGESVSASLAVVDQQLFVRGETNLYCIEEKSE